MFTQFHTILIQDSSSIVTATLQGKEQEIFDLASEKENEYFVVASLQELEENLRKYVDEAEGEYPFLVDATFQVHGGVGWVKYLYDTTEGCFVKYLSEVYGVKSSHLN